MKVYMVLEWCYDFPISTYRVLHVFDDVNKANAKRDELDAVNPRPMEEDDYGPMSGYAYTVWEREVET